MKTLQDYINQRRTLFSWTLFAFLIVVIPIILICTISGYSASSEQLQTSMKLLEQNSEEGVRMAVNSAEENLRIYDTSLDRRMESAFVPFLAAYSRSGGDPASMDLDAIRREIGDSMDLHIINSEGIIEYSTVMGETGYDFRPLTKFYSDITNIREGSSFSADHIVRDENTGEVRKFAYMPTPDHKYLLELGLAPEMLGKYDSRVHFKELIPELRSLNPFLEHIRFYDTMASPIGIDNKTVEPSRKEFLKEVIIRERSDREIIDPTSGTMTKYLFIDLADRDYASDRSIIAEMVYSQALIDQKLRDTLTVHLVIALAAILMSIVMSYLATGYINRPIRKIISDVDTIARGDLEHEVSQGRIEELRDLGGSINTMVATLRKKNQTINDQNERLEERVAKRTGELTEANGQANLYLDIMTHDINNTNAVSLAAMDLLSEELDGKARDLADLAENSVHKSVRIIDNVSTIRQILKRKDKLRSVDLDAVIRTEIAHFPGTEITYTPGDFTVYADDLLSEVFSNLIDNSRKFMGPGGIITISAEGRDDNVMILVSDTGPGVPDSDKEEIFGRFTKGETPKSGRGLGLYIVRSLVEKYGGTIRADDRVAGQPEEGLAIRFILKRA